MGRKVASVLATTLEESPGHLQKQLGAAPVGGGRATPIDMISQVRPSPAIVWGLGSRGLQAAALVSRPDFDRKGGPGDVRGWIHVHVSSLEVHPTRGAERRVARSRRPRNT